MTWRVLIYRCDATSPGTYMLGVGWLRGTFDLQVIWWRILIRVHS